MGAAGSGAANGAGIPGTTTSVRVFVELDFNDNHKIEVITWSVDSGILEKLKSESRSPGDDQLLAAPVNSIHNASGASVGLFVFRGLAPASAHSSAWVEKGEANEKLARKFLAQWIDTDMSSTSDGAWAQYIAHPFTWIINANGPSDTSYSMQGTTWPEMMTKHMAFYAWLGSAIVAPGTTMDPSSVAIDPKSGGRKILATAT